MRIRLLNSRRRLSKRGVIYHSRIYFASAQSLQIIGVMDPTLKGGNFSTLISSSVVSTSSAKRLAEPACADCRLTSASKARTMPRTGSASTKPNSHEIDLQFAFRPGFPPRFFRKVLELANQDANGNAISTHEWKDLTVLDIGTGPGARENQLFRILLLA